MVDLSHKSIEQRVGSVVVDIIPDLSDRLVFSLHPFVSVDIPTRPVVVGHHDTPGFIELFSVTLGNRYEIVISEVVKRVHDLSE